MVGNEEKEANKGRLVARIKPNQVPDHIDNGQQVHGAPLDLSADEFDSSLPTWRKEMWGALNILKINIQYTMGFHNITYLCEWH